ncbi:MAG: DUF5115 domain-containing protein [Prevotella sp.]|nr:DUF5115 domain-containing protein [Prevotella sp.]
MMTKKILLGMAFVASMAACTDDYKDWAEPQEVPAPATVTFGEGSVSAVDVIKLADITGGQQTVKVCNITAPTASDDSFTPSYTITLGNQTYDMNGDGTMAVSDLTGYVNAVYGKAPTQRDIDATVGAWLSNGSTAVKAATSATFKVSVLPDAPFIDEGYWLVGDFAGWDAAGALAFTHVGSGSVYDAPTFTITFTTTADNQYWKIIPQGNYAGEFWAGGETGVLGPQVDGDTSMSGSLTTNDPGAGKIEKAGIYRMTIDMMNYTYTIEEMAFNQFIYFIGSTDGWAAAEQKLETVNFDGVYTGFIYIADPNGWGTEFKFQKVAGDWGTEINSGTVAAGITGDFEDGGGNIRATAGEGVYHITLDLAAGTIHGTKINNMNLVGDFNGWNAADDAQQMTWDAENYCYVITGAGVTTNGWKFTANNDWGINLGGDVNALTQDGANIEKAGTTIKLYPTRKTSDSIYCTIE